MIWIGRFIGIDDDFVQPVAKKSPSVTPAISQRRVPGESLLMRRKNVPDTSSVSDFTDRRHVLFLYSAEVGWPGTMQSPFR